jgi:hypothetical protein
MSARIPRENPVPTALSRDLLEQARQRFTHQQSTMMPHLDAVLPNGGAQAAPKAQANAGAARKISAARKATAAARETPRTEPAAEAA